MTELLGDRKPLVDPIWQDLVPGTLIQIGSADAHLVLAVEPRPYPAWNAAVWTMWHFRATDRTRAGAFYREFWTVRNNRKSPVSSGWHVFPPAELGEHP